MDDTQAGAKAEPKLAIIIQRDQLWRLETVGDLNSAEIQIYHPIKEDGTPDVERKTKFCSLMEVQFMGQTGKMRFEIPGETLTEALNNFQDAGDKFAREMFDRLESERTRALLTSGMTIGEPRPKH